METLKNLYRFLSNRFQSIHLEYKTEFKPRFGHGLPPHEGLYSIINKERELYRNYLEEFLLNKENLQKIKKEDDDANKPMWNNMFLPGLDIVALYGMLVKHKPKRYIEVGSGNSTKVAKKAIVENGLDTQIISIDPYPRAEIDHMVDQVIRMPFENLKNFDLINELEAGDILFIDNSHRCLPNSDVTVFFLETLPKLKKGVIVHIHDIYIPYDYPQFMCDRVYNEQYLLAVALLNGSDKYNLLFPCYFISEDKELSMIMEPMWQGENTQDVEKHGGSFWFRINS